MAATNKCFMRSFGRIMALLIAAFALAATASVACFVAATVVSPAQAYAVSATHAPGWVKSGGSWYHYGSDGKLQTGWFKVGGTWYCADSRGAMRTGWVKSGGTWYYLKGSGAMATGWQKASGKWYRFDSSGAMQTGWVKSGGKWYYLEASGAMAHDRWQGSYYLTSSGAMATDRLVGKYYVGPDGKWQRDVQIAWFDPYATSETSKTVSKFDVTGDGKADAVMVSVVRDSSYDWYDSLAISVNGKAALELRLESCVSEVRFLQLSNGQEYLYVEHVFMNGEGVYSVFQYSGGTLRELIADSDVSGGGHNAINSVEVSGNRLTVEFYCMNFATGCTDATFTYEYNDGALQRTSDTTYNIRYYTKAGGSGKLGVTAKSAFTVYTDATLGAKAFDVAKGEKVTVDAIHVRNGDLYFKVVNSKGKGGWIKEPDEYDSSLGGTMFEECFLAG